MTRKHPVCATCGSAAVKRDAWAEWDHARQSWELETSFDNAFCADCDGETSLEWREGDPAGFEPEEPAEDTDPIRRAFASGFACGMDAERAFNFEEQEAEAWEDERHSLTAAGPDPKAERLLDRLEAVRNWFHEAPPDRLAVAEGAVGRSAPIHQVSEAIELVWLLHGAAR